MRPSTRSLAPLLLVLSSCSDQGLGKFNAQPSASILTHQDGDLIPALTEVPVAGIVDDPDDLPQDLQVTWKVDGGIVWRGAADENGYTECMIVGEPGELVVLLEVLDPAGSAGSDRVDLQVQALDAPTVEILAPEKGTHVYAGTALELATQLSDADDPSENLLYSWESNVQGELVAWAPPSTDGGTQDVVFLEEATHTLTVRVMDDEGNESRASTAVIVQHENRAPSCAILAPTEGFVSVSGQYLTLTGQVDDEDQAPGGLTVRWSSATDGLLFEGNPDSSGVSTFVTNDLSAGSQLLELAVEDELGELCTSRVTIAVDGLPGAPLVAIEPDPATSNDDLRAVIRRESLDPDGDAVSYAYAWFRDGVSVAETSARLPASESSRGETWSVEVTPYDGLAWGEAGSAEIIVGNSPPSLVAASITPSDATSADTLHCQGVGFEDADGDPDLSTFTWSIGGIPIGTGPTVSSGYSRGNLVACMATPNDGMDTGAAVSAAITIGNQPPVIEALSISPSTPTTNDTLSAVVSVSDADGDDVDLAWSWEVNELIAGSASTLDGRSAFDKLDRVRVSVTPSDGFESGETVRSAEVVIGNSLPSAPGIHIEPSDPAGGEDDLVCVVDTPSIDADGDTLTYAMSWMVDGVAWTGEGDTSALAPFTSTWPDDGIPGEATAEGDTWTCTVRPSDGSETGTTRSASVTIGGADLDYSGTWNLGTTVNYRCAYGLVNFNFSTVGITESSPTIVVVASGNVGTMTGSFTSDVDFSATHYLPGGCAETYTMTGTFSDENHFDGGLSATYSGMCFDCSSRSWSFSASR